MQYTLLQLNEFIRQVLLLNLPNAFWIKAEVTQANESRGHYYLDLIQKAEDSDTIVAQSQAILWQKDYRRLRRKIGKPLDYLLKEGVEVLLHAKVDFHERYGFKLLIQNIDPAYTLGQLELKRQETIQKLEKLYLLNKNKAKKLPLVLQRIAVISSENAAGLQDYQAQITNNPYAYHFKNVLFPAAVQGVFVERDILRQLIKISQQQNQFDAVIIIRGGGAKLDLAAFDSFVLCKTVAQFPLPVLTGIGHDIDETVLDMVAHTALKTPTAVADFIINRALHFESEIQEKGFKIKQLAQQLIQQQQLQLQQHQQFIQYQTQLQVQSAHQLLNYIEQEIPKLIQQTFKRETQNLERLEKMVTLLSPEMALQRGFSITMQNGRVIRSVHEVDGEVDLVTKLLDGEVRSRKTS